MQGVTSCSKGIDLRCMMYVNNPISCHVPTPMLVCLFIIVSLFGLVYPFSLNTTDHAMCYPPPLNSQAGAGHQSGKVSASRHFSFSPFLFWLIHTLKPMDR